MVKIGNIEVGEFPLLLAPMEDVSDPPFRAACKAHGADLVYTEFISSEGLIRDAAKSRKKLDFFAYERPLGIQIFGDNIESMRDAARVVEEANPDILDINYGCPVKAVACRGAGAGILKDVDKMEAMTREIVRATSLPVTVKTRLGWDEKSIRIVEVALRLQDAGIKALTIHARTREQMYKGESDWTWIEKVKMHPDMEIPVFGNGDVDSPQKARAMREQFPVDGIMIGRAAIGNPWIFNQIKHYFEHRTLMPEPTMAERVDVCRRHFEFSIEWKGDHTGVVEMRRHYANYFRGVPHFKPYRTQLVTCDSVDGIRALLDEIAALPTEIAVPA